MPVHLWLAFIYGIFRIITVELYSNFFVPGCVNVRIRRLKFITSIHNFIYIWPMSVFILLYKDISERLFLSAAVNKQLNDKERVAAALENPNLRQLVEECLYSSELWEVCPTDSSTASNLYSNYFALYFWNSTLLCVVLDVRCIVTICS